MYKLIVKFHTGQQYICSGKHYQTIWEDIMELDFLWSTFLKVNFWRKNNSIFTAAYDFSIEKMVNQQSGVFVLPYLTFRQSGKVLLRILGFVLSCGYPCPARVGWEILWPGLGIEPRSLHCNVDASTNYTTWDNIFPCIVSVETSFTLGLKISKVLIVSVETSFTLGLKISKFW